MSAPSPQRVAADFLTPKQQHKLDTRNLAKHQADARKAFRVLLGEIAPLAEEAVEAFPQRGTIKQRGRFLLKKLKVDPQVGRFLDTYIGAPDVHSSAGSWRDTAVDMFRKVALGAKGLNDALKTLDRVSGNGYKAITMAEVQRPLKEALPQELRDFLPPNVVVDVDENGSIARITDRFERERFTLEKKIDRMRLILTRYNAIVKQVKGDLKSSDEMLRLAALVTSILMETGIRPGKLGNATIEVINGEKVSVETFGAVTLGASHVRFIRDNFAKLEFKGKMGGQNIAFLSDSDIIKTLQDYVSKAQASGSKFIFVSASGERFTYQMLETYFKRQFKGIAPTDFRKLRATEAVLSALREEQEALYERIRGFANGSTEELRERIVGALVETLSAAIAQAQVALSHDKSTTTVESYIDPGILLRFLSTGKAATTLKDAVLDQRGQLSFDPMIFAQVAGVGMPVAASAVKIAAQWLREAGLFKPPPKMLSTVKKWVLGEYASYILFAIETALEAGASKMPGDILVEFNLIQREAAKYTRDPEPKGIEKKSFSLDFRGWSYLRKEAQWDSDEGDRVNVEVWFSKPFMDEGGWEYVGGRGGVFGKMWFDANRLVEDFWESGGSLGVFKKQVKALSETVDHEVSHFGQAALTVLHATSEVAGLPGIHWRGQEFDNINDLLHDEFYPRLRDEVGRFQDEATKIAKSGWREFFDWWIRNSGIFATIYEQEDKLKWKKAVGEFYKALNREGVEIPKRASANRTASLREVLEELEKDLGTPVL